MNPKTKLTPAGIEAMVGSFTYTMLPSGRAMVCEAILLNGHAVHGIANVIDPENFDEEVGRAVSKSRCLQAVGDYAAYEMQASIHRIKNGIEVNWLDLKLGQEDKA